MIELDKLVNEIINNGYQVTEQEAFELMNWNDAEELFAAADKIRKAMCGDFFDTCSIINARSGCCPEDCKWCSQSHKHNTGVKEYPLIGVDEAMKLGKRNNEAGVHWYSLVTSGRTMTDDQIDKCVEIFKELRKSTKLNLCASMGLLNKSQLQKLHDAGVNRFHCNIETAPSFFPKLCTTHTTADKVQTIKWAREVGMAVCSGGIIGMGETPQQRVEMAVYLRSIGVDSIPLNVLMAIKGTALENAEPITEDQILRTMAMFRFVNPKAYIRMAAGRAKFNNDKAIRAGVNSSIVGDMLTTAVVKTIEDDMQKFESAGFRTRE